MPVVEDFFNNSLGTVEINLHYFRPSSNSLRVRDTGIEDLIRSISRVGLLQPLVVRSKDSYFEIVAGNRRYFACKRLGLQKIPAHIIEIDDKTAFEISLIENLQRETLTPVEEGIAFTKYVNEFGWGGVSELAKRLTRSPSYISRRMKLLELPQGVLEMISQSEICVSTAEELLRLDTPADRSQLALKIRDNRIPIRKVSKSIETEGESFISDYLADRDNVHKSFDRSIAVLRVAMFEVGNEIEKLHDSWIFHEIMMQHRSMLHAQIDLLIKQKRRSKNVRHDSTTI